jgi:hypothetical protein
VDDDETPGKFTDLDSTGMTRFTFIKGTRLYQFLVNIYPEDAGFGKKGGWCYNLNVYRHDDFTMDERGISPAGIDVQVVADGGGLLRDVRQVFTDIARDYEGLDK